jgi:hypothetical protein
MQSGFSTSLLSRLILDVTVRAGQIGGFISRNRAYLQTAAGAIALALGFWGWMIEKPPADFRGMLDNVFRTVQLITLQFPTDLNSSPNYQLQIARLAVPVVAILATFQVLIASITRPARLALLPYTSGHIVVCGSAQITQSALKTLASAGRRRGIRRRRSRRPRRIRPHCSRGRPAAGSYAALRGPFAGRRLLGAG